MGLLRLAAVCFAALCLFSADSALASPRPYLGSWHGSAVVKRITPITLDLLFFPNGRFAERISHDRLKIADFGTYTAVGRSSVTLRILRACDRFTCRKLAKPHILAYLIQSISPSKMVLQEKTYGGILILKRVQQKTLKETSVAPSAENVPR